MLMLLAFLLGIFFLKWVGTYVVCMSVPDEIATQKNTEAALLLVINMKVKVLDTRAQVQSHKRYCVEYPAVDVPGVWDMQPTVSSLSATRPSLRTMKRPPPRVNKITQLYMHQPPQPV